MRVRHIAGDMWKTEGIRAFWKGIVPRVMRVAPGQAVTFTVYEWIRGHLEASKMMQPADRFEE